MPVHIRPATFLDFPAAATFSALAFKDDELFHFIKPHAARWPGDFRGGFLRQLRSRMVMPGCVFIVAVGSSPPDKVVEGGEQRGQDGGDAEDEAERSGLGEGEKEGEDGEGIGGRRIEEGLEGNKEEGEKEEVVGYALWRRDGTSEGARRWQGQSWGEWFESLLLGVEERYTSLFRPDRSASAARAREFDEMEEAQGGDEFRLLPERWHLQMLCVHPSHQRRGIGAALVAWGLEYSKKEGVPATLNTSTVAEPLYRRLGFETWMKRDFPGIRMGAPSLVWWPEGVERITGHDS